MIFDWRVRKRVQRFGSCEKWLLDYRLRPSAHLTASLCTQGPKAWCKHFRLVPTFRHCFEQQSAALMPSKTHSGTGTQTSFEGHLQILCYAHLHEKVLIKGHGQTTKALQEENSSMTERGTLYGSEQQGV